MNQETGGIRSDYLSHRNTMTLRLILIAGIFIFHAGLHYAFDVPLIGYTCVAVFFFLSGFGLEYSLKNKEGYMRTFLQKRTFGLLLQYALIMLFCALVAGIVHMSADVFVNDAKHYMFEYTNWFILEMLVFYALFFISAMIGNPKVRMTFLAVSTFLSMYAMYRGYGTDLYYTSGASFLFGILWFRHKDEVDAFLSKWYLPAFLLLTVLLLYPQRDDNTLIDMATTSATGILSSTLTCVILMADIRCRWYVPLLAIAVGGTFMYVQWDYFWQQQILIEGAAMMVIAGSACMLYQLPHVSRATAYLGAMSLELFLLHFATFGWAEKLVGDDVTQILILSAAITLVVSFAAYKLVGTVMHAYQKGVDRLSE